MTERANQKLRAAVIGCGLIGCRYDMDGDGESIYTHAGMYQTLPDYELVALCDRDARKLKQAGEVWPGALLFEDPAQMLAETTPDVVSVATPDSEHASMVRLCLTHAPGGVIFCEKPLGSDSTAAQGLFERAESVGSTIIVDYIRRWDANHQDLKRRLAKGQWGEVQTVVGCYVRGLRHNGCHLVNLARFLFGPVGQVQAIGPQAYDAASEDPSLNAIIQSASGVPMHMVAVDPLGYSFSIFELDIFCQKGRIRVLAGGEKYEVMGVEDHPVFTGFKHLARGENPWPENTYGKAMLNAGKEIARVARGDKSQSLNSAQSAYADLLVIEAIHQSAKQNYEPVTIPSV